MYPEYWIPRRVRRGDKQLPELRTKFTENNSTARGAVDWLYEAIQVGRISFDEFNRVHDRYGDPEAYLYEFLESICGAADETTEGVLQEIIDYALFHTEHEDVIRSFNRYAVLSHLNWQASPKPPYQLMQRVLPEVEKNYLDCAGRAPDATSKCLDSAWRAAYGSTPEPMKAWREAIRAVETLLAPVVAPKAKLATLGSMKSTVRQGLGKGKWSCSLPVDGVDDPCANFLKLLEMLEYEPGRHNANDPGPSVEAARVQVQLSLAICQIIMDEGFKRNDEVLDEEGV